MIEQRGRNGSRNNSREFGWEGTWTSPSNQKAFVIIPMQSCSILGLGWGGLYLISLRRICISSRNKTFEVVLKLHSNMLYLHPIY